MEVDDKIPTRNNPQYSFRREGTFDVSVPANNNNNNNNSPGLHRLRYQLASEGCPESQTSLAKSLLREHTENINEKKENDELAVRWLLKAVEEGAHQEALNLLRECYTLGIGITSANKAKVEKCLNSTSEEKIAQYVGQTLFRQMTFDMKESIPLYYFKLKIDSFLSGNEVNSEELTDQGIAEKRSISVDEVVTSICQCLIGKAPDLFIASSVPGKLKTNNKAVKFVANKGIEILVCAENLLRILSDIAVIHSLLIVGVAAALFLMILPNILVDQANSFIINATNAFISCGSYVVMVFSSAKMLYRRQARENIEKWIRVVEKFDVKLEPTRMKTSVIPELNLFALLIVGAYFFFTFTEQPGEWIVNRHLLFLSLINFIAIKPNKLAKILYLGHFTTAFLNFHVLPIIFPQWKEYYAFAFKISETIHLNISLLGTLGICLILLHLFIITKLRMKDYLVNLSSILWINIFTGALTAVTFSSLTSDLTFMALLFMGSSRMTQFSTYGSLVAAESAVSLTMTGSALGIGTFIFILLSTKARYLQSKFQSPRIIAFCLLILCSSTLYLTSNNKKIIQKPNKEISWSEYAFQCHHPAWQESNMAKVQMQCDKYHGYKMSVIGSIGYVKRIKRENPIESMIYTFSQTTQSWLRFIFEEDLISIAVKKLSSCCLQKWTANQYEIKVQIKGTFRVEAELIFLVNDICDQFALKLHDNDDVKITGMFLDKMGMDHPVLNLLEGKCLSCIERVICNAYKASKDLQSSMKQISVTNVNSYFLEPIGLFLM